MSLLRCEGEPVKESILLPKNAVIRVYDLADEDARSDYEIDIRAKKMYLALLGFDNWLRSEIKYNKREDLQPVRDKLYEEMNESGFDFEDIA